MDRPKTPAVANRSHMLTYLRYALATFCFAVCVGCLALWVRSYAWIDTITSHDLMLRQGTFVANTSCGLLKVGLNRIAIPYTPRVGWEHVYTLMPERERIDCREFVAEYGRFHVDRRTITFPLWYPALVFALAGVDVLQVGRFTIRSAIIATTIAAGLLGMAVTL